jgi:DNA-binding NtrC family response regulator
MKSTILVVDDQLSFCRHLEAILENEGYTVLTAHSAERALARLAAQPVDILLADLKMPGTDGITLFEMARKMDPNMSCIIMTGYATISSAVEAIKKGVTDYLQKPFEPEAMFAVLEKALRERRMRQEIRDLRREVVQRYSFGNIIGKNQKMQHIYDLIRSAAPTDARVLITGETGVGKELVAKAIHFNSPRKNHPFVGINCGALSEGLLESELFGHEKGAFTGAIRTKKGKFEYAAGGTIFLDEIGDISPPMQVKLLRVLQEKSFERVGGNQLIHVDARIISATNQGIKEKIQSGQFRVELFYRLNVIPIHIPPLRERIEDIPLLVRHFLQIFNKRMNKQVREVSERAMRELMEYDWPGNVRELENVLERSFVITTGDIIDTVIFSRDLKPDVGGAIFMDGVNIEIPFKVARSVILTQFEKSYLFEAFRRYGGNVSKVAKATNINPRTLWRKVKAYQLDKDQF